MDIRIKFGNRIREIRKNKLLSQENLANLAEIDRTYMPDIEKGKTAVSIVIIEKLAIALGVTVKELFHFEEDNSK
jgi:transcriptional regulator with XRE-family HTH domain